MLGGRYRYEFFNCWRNINEKGTANYTDVYKDSAKVFNSPSFLTETNKGKNISLIFKYLKNLDIINDRLSF